MLNFINTYWNTLTQIPGFIVSLATPIVKARYKNSGSSSRDAAGSTKRYRVRGVLKLEMDCKKSMKWAVGAGVVTYPTIYQVNDIRCRNGFLPRIPGGFGTPT